MRMDRRLLVVGAAAASAAFAVRRSFAQGYPSRPIRLVVPYPAGGGTDFFARVVATPMGETLGQTIVIENRAGAGTNIGAEVVARADPDGHVFLLGDTATFAANRSLYSSLAFDPAKDFAPITLTGRFAIVLLVNTDKLPVASVRELIDMAKKAPGKIHYASGGVGNPFHLASALFAQAAGVELTHVPYRGAAPALQDLVAGQVDMMLVDFATARGQLTNKQLKAIAVASPGEFYGLPGVPPVAKDLPGYEAWAWQGFVVPAGTPPDIVGKINASYLATVKKEDIVAKLNGAGIEVLQSTPAEFAAYMKSETEKWERVVKAANIRAD